VINTGASFRRLDLWALANRIWEMRSDVSQTQLSIITNQNLAWENGQAGSFVVNRTGDLSNALSLNYRLAGTATAGSDYQPLSGTAVFLAGQSTTQIMVTAIDDLIAESGETIKISLAIGNGYQLTKNYQASLAIVDDDSLVYSSFSSESSSFDELLPSIASTTRDFTDIANSFFIPAISTPLKITYPQIELIASDASTETNQKRTLQPTESLLTVTDLNTEHSDLWQNYLLNSIAANIEEEYLLIATI
jgi:hypothetical protein